MVQPPAPDPPHTGKRRSARLSRADTSHVGAPVPSHGPTEDEAEESPMKKQRSGRTKRKLGPKAKDTSDIAPLDSNTSTLKAPREPNVERSPATVNLNNFYTLLPRLSINPKAQFEYTPALARTRHVLDCDIYENRDFRVIDVALEETQHRRTAQSDGRKKMAWRIRVSDRNDPDSRILQPFRIEPYDIQWRARLHGADTKDPKPQVMVEGTRYPQARYEESLRISEEAVPTETEATKIAELFCRVLNRTPLDLPAFDSWGRPNSSRLSSRVARFTELVTLLRYNRDVDVSSIDMSFYVTSSPPEIKFTGDKVNYSFTDSHLHILLDRFGRAVDTASHGPDRVQTARVTISSAQVDQTQAAKIDVPSGFLSVCALVGSSTSETLLALSVCRHIDWQLFGHTGTREEYITESKALKAGFVKVNASGHKWDFGPLNHARPFSAALATHSRTREWTSSATVALREALLVDMKVTQYSPHDSKISPLRILIQSESRIMHSYISERGLQSLARGDRPHEFFFEMCEAADQVNLNVGPAATPQTVLDVYCTCKPEMGKNHICQGCGKLDLCTRMPHADDGRKLCGGCHSIGNLDTLSLDATKKKLRRLVRDAVGTDFTLIAKPNDLLLCTNITDKLVERFVSDPTLRVFEDAYSKTHENTDGTGPDRVSLDKPHPLWIEREKGKTVVHLHHTNNAVLTKECINLLGGRSLKCSLPWLKAAYQTAKKTVTVTAEYPLEHRPFWDVFERFADSEFMIRRIWVPYRMRDRLTKMKITQADFAKTFIPMARSGKWDGSKPKKGFVGEARPRSLGSIQDGQPHKDFKMWSSEEIQDIQDLLTQAETDFLRYNKNKLKLPRTADGVPLLFSTQHEFEWTWTTLFQEMRARLRRILEDCDEKNADVNFETPRSMLIEFVIQWFETGGKCWLFGFRLTWVVGHIQCSSVGRGMYRYDRNGRPTEFIQAGAQMMTGCIVPSSTDSNLMVDITDMDEYDYTRRTIVIESWKANSVRFNYSSDSAMLRVIRRAIEGIYDVTEHYDAIDLEIKNFPDLLLRFRRATIRRDDTAQSEGEGEGEDADDNADDNADDGDEEIAFLAGIREANADLAKSDGIRVFEECQKYLLQLYDEMLPLNSEVTAMVEQQEAPVLYKMMRKILMLIEVNPGRVRNATLEDVIPAAALRIFTPAWKNHRDENEIPLQEFTDRDLINWRDSPILSEFMEVRLPGVEEENEDFLTFICIENEQVQWRDEQAFKSSESGEEEAMPEANTLAFLQSILRLAISGEEMLRPGDTDAVMGEDVISEVVPFFNQAWRRYKREWRAVDLYGWQENEALFKFMYEGAVDEAGVDEAGVDEAGVDEAGVDEAGVDDTADDAANEAANATAMDDATDENAGNENAASQTADVPLCSNCMLPEVEGSMVTCSAPGCQHRFHLVCHWSKLQKMPESVVGFCCEWDRDAEPAHIRARYQPRLPAPSAPSARPQHTLILNDNAATCYADCAMQVLFRLPGVREIILRKEKFVCNRDEQSGRKPHLDGPQKSAQHLKNVHALCLQMHDICQSMFNGPAGMHKPVEVSTLRRFFKQVSLVDPSYDNMRANESSGFFNLLVESLVMATDVSGPAPNHRDLMGEFDQQQNAMESSGMLNSALHNAMNRLQVHREVGRESPFQDLFNTSFISERECGEFPSCQAIMRSFGEENMFHCHFPPNTTDNDTYTLEWLLQQTIRQEDDGGECLMDKLTHKRGTVRINRITFPPTFLVIAFDRQGHALMWNGRDDRLCQVQLPVVFDLSPYSNRVRLPSESRSDQPLSDYDNPYQICAVTMFKAVHYVAFLWIDGEWVCFDGLSQSRQAYAKSPYQAAKEGWVQAMVVYERQKPGVQAPPRAPTPEPAQTSPPTQMKAPKPPPLAHVKVNAPTAESITPENFELQAQRFREQQRLFKEEQKIFREEQRSFRDEQRSFRAEQKSFRAEKLKQERQTNTDLIKRLRSLMKDFALQIAELELRNEEITREIQDQNGDEEMLNV
jgi:hypothetical protein